MKKLFLVLIFTLLLIALVSAEVDVWIEDQTVFVENIGTDIYVEPIMFRLTSNRGEINIVRDTEINPGDIIEIDLGVNSYTGVYDLYVGNELFRSGVYIEGVKTKFNYNFLFGLSIILFIIFIYLIITYRKRNIRRMIMRKRQNRLDQIYTQADPEKKYVNEFRERMINKPPIGSYSSSSKPITFPKITSYRESLMKDKVKMPKYSKLRFSDDSLSKFRENSSFLRRAREREDK